MIPTKKVWVIDVGGEPGGDPGTGRPGRAVAGDDRGGLRREQTPACPTRRERQPTRRSGDAAGDVGAAHAPTACRRAHSLIAVVCTYVFGPLVPLVVRRRSVELVWAGLGLVALAAWVASWCLPRLGAAWAERAVGHLGVLPVLVLAALSGLVVCTAWARAIGRLGEHARRLREGWPRVGRDARVAAGLGLVVPGIGLLLGRHPVRAAGAWWTAGLLAVCSWFLVHAAWLWTINQTPAVWRLRGQTLEAVLLGALGVGGLAAVTWLIQLLDGVRIALSNPVSRRVGAGSPVGGRGDRLALALLVALAVFLVLFDPAATAKLFDDLALDLETCGLRLMPLGLAQAAATLDPGNPGHLMHVAALHAALGRPELAARQHEALRRRWRVYELERSQARCAVGRAHVPANSSAVPVSADGLPELRD